MHLEPIGTFHCEARYPYDAARQSPIAESNGGNIVFEKGHNYEQALQNLGGFSHIWLIYVFHLNQNWKPMVQPPRASRKVGVFASRAPYRPNPIGLSCVELISIQGLIVNVGPHDLLDGTPILDIKPYLPYADSFPEAKCGWVEDVAEDLWEVCFALEADQQLAWLERAGVKAIRAFLRQQLRELPFDQQRKRIRPIAGTQWEIAYRTWRIDYGVDETARRVMVQRVRSAYTDEDLLSLDDRYEDKAQHREFRNAFRT
ncbi:MAG: tRNA (N6-threonylcarbamoyladenosine(37)-N6)-methyltransferase TrmO [Candidatus Hydrogenedentes bacterium]|nr:tRNA (N6-threonylcarbamoyladenosine(37)-N6)-methyltransferase TrmO [Candidatus Hydrogenedentota bacterium]